MGSGWFWGVSAIVGAAVTYALSIEADLAGALVLGAVWGVVVGSSLGVLIDSLLNFSRYKWNALGWIVVAAAYGYWVTFRYEGEPHTPIAEAVYWRFFSWSLASLVLGFVLLGSILSVKLGQKKGGAGR